MKLALFLPIMLVFSSVGVVWLRSYFGQTGGWGGPTASAAEPDYPGDNAYMLEAPASLGASYGTLFPIKKNVQEGVMETALFSGSEPITHDRADQTQEGPDLGNYFSMPARGRDWGKLHPHNAVDIANFCGTDIRAAADGMVNEISAADDWNGGYGNFILLSHSNGTRTRYAHLQKVLVHVGQYVKKGEIIGKIGETGNATGCHVHFEVIGAVNPFVR